MNSFPPVATVIGLSQEVVESGPLLATLAVDPSIIAGPTVKCEPVEEIKTGDPVTQAVVDNIMGKLPVKKERVVYRCELCNISTCSQENLENHYAGAKHARKIQGQQLLQEISKSPNSAFISGALNGGQKDASTEYTCGICSVRVNSYQQLEQHLSGTKHKTKAETSKSNTMQVPIIGNSEKGVMNVDIGPNRLYCAACDVRVNSDLQLHQHIMSNKHANKVNGRVTVRDNPYKRQSEQGGFKKQHFSRGWNRAASGQQAPHSILPEKLFVPGGKTPFSRGWSQSGSEEQAPHSVLPEKPFVSGGLYIN